jgi:DNA gyrase subunit A
MFATRSGNVRRNSLSDFESINRNGKIAMKLDEGDQIVGVALATPDQDVMLTTAKGQAVRFLISEEVRLFKGRDSTGVRGIRLEDGDQLISLAILDHAEASVEERTAYLKRAIAERRAANSEGDEGDATPATADEEGAGGVAELSEDRYQEMKKREQFLLAVSERGFGKRSSSYEYRISGRGGKGIAAMVVNERNGDLVAAFPVLASDQIMLVTDAGKLIRCPVGDVRIAGRNTQGVRIFRTDDAEKVVSVERVSDDGSADAAGDGEGEPASD